MTIKRSKAMEKDGRIEDLSEIYGELDDERRKKMEVLAEGLLNVQLIVENEDTVQE
jgi:hypothetical protein